MFALYFRNKFHTIGSLVFAIKLKAKLEISRCRHVVTHSAKKLRISFQDPTSSGAGVIPNSLVWVSGTNKVKLSYSLTN
jgi:hypothetical protein